ncbi:hypothetical protein RQP46_007251 [Phenoliferia psychrophenolica]
MAAKSASAALLEAVTRTTGAATSPTYLVHSSNSTSPEHFLSKVYAGEYWGAIWATEGASARFQDAVASAGFAVSYNASAALCYTGLEVRYNSVWITFVLSSLLAVRDLAADQFVETTAFVPELDRIIGQSGAYETDTMSHIQNRLPVAVVWTLVTSLSSTGWTVAFSEGLHLQARNFFALWAVAWVYAMILFDVLDALAVLVSAQAGTLVVGVIWIHLSGTYTSD